MFEWVGTTGREDVRAIARNLHERGLKQSPKVEIKENENSWSERIEDKYQHNCIALHKLHKFNSVSKTYSKLKVNTPFSTNEIYQKPYPTTHSSESSVSNEVCI